MDLRARYSYWNTCRINAPMSLIVVYKNWLESQTSSLLIRRISALNKGKIWAFSPFLLQPPPLKSLLQRVSQTLGRRKGECVSLWYPQSLGFQPSSPVLLLKMIPCRKVRVFFPPSNYLWWKAKVPNPNQDTKETWRDITVKINCTRFGTYLFFAPSLHFFLAIAQNCLCFRSCSTVNTDLLLPATSHDKLEQNNVEKLLTLQGWPFPFSQNA